MTPTRALAIVELQCRIARLEIHARNALVALANTPSNARHHHNGSSERMTSRLARRAVRNLRALATARAHLAATEAT